MTCTIIPLLSLVDPGGAFDVPKLKCPPDRGSSDCVTGDPAPFFSSSPPLSSSPNSVSDNQLSTYLPSGYCSAQITGGTLPQRIPKRSHSDLSTPPLTPDVGSECDGGPSYSSPSYGTEQKDALEILLTLFPQHGLAALPYSKSVAISAPELGAVFEGVVLEMPNQPKTLYVDAKCTENLSLRESIVALLDLADEALHCEALIIILERSSPNLGETLHSLMYVGGTVVTAPIFPLDSAFVLVGLNI